VLTAKKDAAKEMGKLAKENGVELIILDFERFKKIIAKD